MLLYFPNSAFCLGPFIQFFNGLVSERVLHYKPGGQ